MDHEKIEIRLEGDLYRKCAEIADLADVPIEHIIRLAVAMHTLRFEARDKNMMTDAGNKPDLEHQFQEATADETAAPNLGTVLDHKELISFESIGTYYHRAINQWEHIVKLDRDIERDALLPLLKGANVRIDGSAVEVQSVSSNAVPFLRRGAEIGLLVSAQITRRRPGYSHP